RLCRVAHILSPHRDFDWLRKLEAELKLEMRPRNRTDRIINQQRLWKLGLDLIARAEQSPDLTLLRRARLYRDGLMIALLSVCPIRLKNLASLEVGRHIRKCGDEWWLILDETETKSGRPDERPIPGELGSHIERWLGYWTSAQPFSSMPIPVRPPS